MRMEFFHHVGYCVYVYLLHASCIGREIIQSIFMVWGPCNSKEGRWQQVEPSWYLRRKGHEQMAGRSVEEWLDRCETGYGLEPYPLVMSK